MHPGALPAWTLLRTYILSGMEERTHGELRLHDRKKNGQHDLDVAPTLPLLLRTWRLRRLPDLIGLFWIF